MAFDHILTLLLVLTYFPYLSRSSLFLPGINETPAPDKLATLDRVVSPTVFAALEELARIVDVSYCVGSTGIQKPFDCLSHCAEFQGFELIAVSSRVGPLLLLPSV